MPHTPGPYTVDFSTVAGHCGFKIMAGEKVVGIAYADVVTSELSMKQHALSPRNRESVATAKVLATAPDLLKDLTLVLALAELKYGNLDPDANIAFQRARATLLKATGDY